MTSALAERSDFVKRFRKGTLERDSYSKMLCALYYVYSTMEQELERHKEHPIIKSIHFPEELNRTEHLIRDLTFFYGEEWRDHVKTPSQVTKQYVERLIACSKVSLQTLDNDSFRTLNSPPSRVLHAQ